MQGVDASLHQPAGELRGLPGSESAGGVLVGAEPEDQESEATETEEEPSSSEDPAAGPPRAEPQPPSRRLPPPGMLRGRPRPASPGTYRVVLTVDGQEFTQTVRIEPDPDAPVTADEETLVDQEDTDEEEEERRDRTWIDD